MRRSSLLAPFLVAACAVPGTAPGTGWSRAPDLSVYSAMATYARVARDEAALCYGYSPAGVAERWDGDFGSREAAVAAALTARHGADAVARALAQAVATRTVECPEVQDDRWRRHYRRLLHLLEMRLGLA